jgi:hypothetical protein
LILALLNLSTVFLAICNSQQETRLVKTPRLLLLLLRSKSGNILHLGSFVALRRPRAFALNSSINEEEAEEGREGELGMAVMAGSSQGSAAIMASGTIVSQSKGKIICGLAVPVKSKSRPSLRFTRSPFTGVVSLGPSVLATSKTGAIAAVLSFITAQVVEEAEKPQEKVAEPHKVRLPCFYGSQSAGCEPCVRQGCAIAIPDETPGSDAVLAFSWREEGAACALLGGL